MKKIAALIIAAVLSASALASCGTSSTVNSAVAASTAEKVTGMTMEKAAGTYELSEMTEIGGDSKINATTYEYNRITLTASGRYTLEVKVKEGDAITESGEYEISSDGGYITLLNGGTIAAVGEQIACDGTTLAATGSLGSQLSVTMVYKNAEKVTVEENDGEDGSEE